MGIITDDNREKLEQQADEIRSKVVGRYGAVELRDLVSPRRLIRYHPREAAILGGVLAGAAGLGLARLLRDPEPPARGSRGARWFLLGAVAGLAAIALTKGAMAYASSRIRGDRLELPPMPPPKGVPSLDPPDIDAFTIKKKG